MIKVLFVCLGNICRSPLAETLFFKHLEVHHLSSSFIVDSCGTASYHIGELADARTRKVAKDFGIEMPHRARQFKEQDFDDFDYILVMDESNYKNLKNVNSAKAQKLMFLRSFEPNFKDLKEVPDPYYGDLKGFYEVHEIINNCTQSLLDYIKNRKNEEPN
jgi:protein-tyrosine phosphatase